VQETQDFFIQIAHLKVCQLHLRLTVILYRLYRCVTVTKTKELLYVKQLIFYNIFLTRAVKWLKVSCL